MSLYSITDELILQFFLVSAEVKGCNITNPVAKFQIYETVTYFLPGYLFRRGL